MTKGTEYQKYPNHLFTSRAMILLLFGSLLFLIPYCIYNMSENQEPSLQPNFSDTGKNSPDALILLAFHKWMDKYQKQYTTLEEAVMRFEIFRDNFWKIKSITDEGHSYTVGFTKFSDLTFEEFKALYLSNIEPEQFPFTTRPLHSNGEIPQSLDWREKGAVTEVRDQQQCFSSWAFSVSGGLEGLYKITHKKLTKFSEQQLLDCSRPYGTKGCGGGQIELAYNYLRDYGIEEEKVYPYKGVEQACKYDEDQVAFRILGFTSVMSEDPEQLAIATASQPVSAGIQGDSPVFQFYKGGILDSSACGTEINAAVLIIGYNNTSSKPYWIVKNSWGESWGENGYAFIKKTNKAGPGVCGIAKLPFYPILKHE